MFADYKNFSWKNYFLMWIFHIFLFNFLASANQLRKPMFLNEVTVTTKSRTPFYDREWRNGFTVVFNFIDFLQVPPDTVSVHLLKDFRTSSIIITISIIFSREAFSLWSYPVSMFG